MNVAPLTIDTILRSNRRDRPLLVGWLIENLVEAVHKIAPDFAPEPRVPLRPSRLTAQVDEVSAARRRGPLARWVRRLDGDEQGQGLAEYALILAQVAVLAIVALLFLGSQIADTLSRIGASITPS